MQHPIPARARALDGPTPRAVVLAFAAAAFLGACTALSGAATAGCVCRCVDGKARAVCSSGTDIPPLCSSTACPLSPPKASPMDTLQPPPAVKPGCKIRQVYNPETGRYEWGQLCQ